MAEVLCPSIEKFIQQAEGFKGNYYLRAKPVPRVLPFSSEIPGFKQLVIMKILLLLSFVGIACSSYQESQRLSNTKWVYYFGDCSDYYEFIDDAKYNFYSCESGDTFYGNYFLKGDTVIIEQLYGAYDKNFSEDSRHRTPQLKYKLLLTYNKQLEPIERWEFQRGKWSKSDFQFDKDYYFTKE